MHESKEKLRTKIDTMRQRQDSTNLVISALVRSELCEDILMRLRRGQSIEMISEWIKELSPIDSRAASTLSHTSSDETRATSHILP